MTKYLSDADIAARYSLKAKSTVWRWAKSGRLPAPVRLSPGCTRWLATEIDARDAELLTQQRKPKAA